MKDRWNKLLEFIVYSNIFIAVCAVALIFATYELADIPPVTDGLALLVFSATLFIYILQRIYPGKEIAAEASAMQMWLSRHKKLMWVLLAASLVTGGIAFFILNAEVRMAMVILGFFTLAYSLPIFPGGKRFFRLRDLGLLKTVFVALVWTGTTVWLPVVHLGPQLFSTSGITWLLAERFLFILAITIPFDIRDIRFDEMEIPISTLPMKIGINRTKILSLAILGAFAIAAFSHYVLMSEGEAVNFVMLLFSALGAAYLVLRIGQDTRELYYLLYLDGMMLVQYALVWVGNHWL